jgi:transketolase
MIGSEQRLEHADFVRCRKRLLRMHYESGVGHIGGNLSSLDAMLIVLHEYLTTSDTFILSKGHSAGALYTALWSTGRLSEDDLTTFTKDGTRLAAHPPVNAIPGIPFATGSLGHGLSLAGGTALGYRLRRSPSRVFCLTSDGEWQEGSTWEALIFAAHHRLGNLTVLVDHNELQGIGTTTEVASMAPLSDRLAGFDIAIDTVDGHDPSALRRAIEDTGDRPHFIIMRTIKGHGVSFMANRMEWHYLPMNAAQFAVANADLDRV